MTKSFAFLCYLFLSLSWSHASLAKRIMDPFSSPAALTGSPEQYYNDALSAEGKGDLLLAALDLQRALTLQPTSQINQWQLREVLGKLGLPMETSWQTKLSSYCSPEIFILGGSLIGWVAAFLAIWLFFTHHLSRKKSPKKKDYLILTSVILLFFLGHGIAILGTIIDPRRIARDRVMLFPKEEKQDHISTIPLRSTPIENGTVIAQLPAGSMLILLSKHGVWSYVRTYKGQQGWISSANLESLIPIKLSLAP